MLSEKAFKLWLKDRFSARNRYPGRNEAKGKVWFNTTEAAHGGSIGAADMWFLIPGTTQFVPVELKIAEAISDQILRPRFVMATQVAWHDKLFRAGGRSCFAFATITPEDQAHRWNVWVLNVCNQETLGNWKRGIPFDSMVRVATDNEFHYWAWWHALEGDKP